MKNMKLLILIFLGILIFNPTPGFPQRGKVHHEHGRPNGKTKVIVHHNNHQKKVVVKSRYRPKHIVVYHPFWAPKRNYNRRWVYFPRHNFYWDNWRQVYVYRNGTVWITNTTPPPFVVNVTIENEKHYELKEVEDDTDDVYSTNPDHKLEYKAE